MTTYKKIHSFTFDLGVKVIRNVAQYPLHHMAIQLQSFKLLATNGLGGDTFTRNKTGGRTDAQRTDFGTNLIYPFFLKKKEGIKISRQKAKECRQEK